LRLRPDGLDAGHDRAGQRRSGSGRFASERCGEEILPGYQDDSGKRDGIEDIALVVHRKTPFPSCGYGLSTETMSDRQPGWSILFLYQGMDFFNRSG
jgi:hypothetical protein